jgi:hypothetical protein
MIDIKRILIKNKRFNFTFQPVPEMFQKFLVLVLKVKLSVFHCKIKKLGDRDSNPGSMVQSHVSCRWTIPQ